VRSKADLMQQVRSFVLGVAMQAGFGLAALIVTRWGFRSWPQGAYTWIPAAVAVAEIIVLVAIGYALSARGLPFGLVVAAWYLGRLAGALASWLLPGVGLDAVLLDAASFGVLTSEGGRLAFGAPSLAAIVLPLAVLVAAGAWGRRARLPR